MCEKETPVTYHTFAAAAQSVSPEIRRAHAVAAAMELIASRARHVPDFDMGKEMERLSDYSDYVQEALVFSRQ